MSKSEQLFPIAFGYASAIGRGLEVRNLVPHYFISTHPVGWRCGDCGKVFRLPLSVSQQASSAPDEKVKTEFGLHSCESYLAEIQQKMGKTAAE